RSDDPLLVDDLGEGGIDQAGDLSRAVDGAGEGRLAVVGLDEGPDRAQEDPAVVGAEVPERPLRHLRAGAEVPRDVVGRGVVRVDAVLEGRGPVQTAAPLDLVNAPGPPLE